MSGSWEPGCSLTVRSKGPSSQLPRDGEVEAAKMIPSFLTVRGV